MAGDIGICDKIIFCYYSYQNCTLQIFSLMKNVVLETIKQSLHWILYLQVLLLLNKWDWFMNTLVMMITSTVTTHVYRKTALTYHNKRKIGRRNYPTNSNIPGLLMMIWLCALKLVFTSSFLLRALVCSACIVGNTTPRESFPSLWHSTLSLVSDTRKMQ